MFLKLIIFLFRLETLKNTEVNKFHLWCFLFCKEDITLLQGALKKFLTSYYVIYNIILCMYVWQIIGSAI